MLVLSDYDISKTGSIVLAYVHARLFSNVFILKYFKVPKAF